MLYGRSLEYSSCITFTFPSFFSLPLIYFCLQHVWSRSLFLHLRWPNLKCHHFNLANCHWPCSICKSIGDDYTVPSWRSSQQQKLQLTLCLTVPNLWKATSLCVLGLFCFSLRLCTTLYYNYLFSYSECHLHYLLTPLTKQEMFSSNPQT